MLTSSARGSERQTGGAIFSAGNNSIEPKAQSDVPKLERTAGAGRAALAQHRGINATPECPITEVQELVGDVVRGQRPWPPQSGGVFGPHLHGLRHHGLNPARAMGKHAQHRHTAGPQRARQYPVNE